MYSSNVLIDIETGTEIIFDALEPAYSQTYNCEMIEYSRWLDGVHVTDLISPNQRQMEITVRVSDITHVRRQLDYYRSAAKPLVLVIAADYFASEVIIKNFEVLRGNESASPIKISMACYGIEGFTAMATDNRIGGTGQVVSDEFSMLGNVVKLSNAGDRVSFDFLTNPAYLSAGIYMFIMRIRARASVYNDVRLSVKNFGQVANQIKTIVSSDITADKELYMWYATVATIYDSDVFGDLRGKVGEMSFIVQKLTTASNDITVDCMALFPTSGNISIPAYTLTGILPGPTIPTSYVVDQFQLDTVAGPRAVPLTTLGGAAHTASTSSPGFYEQVHAGGDVKTFYYDWNKNRYLRILSVNVACDTATTLTVYHCWRVLGAVKRLHAYTMTLTAAQAKAGVNTDYPIVLDVPHGTIGWIETRATDACTVSVNVMARYNSITF